MAAEGTYAGTPPRPPDSEEEIFSYPENGYDADFNNAVRQQQQISQSTQESDFSMDDTLSLPDTRVVVEEAVEVVPTQVEIAPSDAEQQIHALEEQIRQLRLQIPTYSSAMMQPDEMNELMVNIEASIKKSILETIATHVQRKPVAPGSPNGTKTMMQILRTGSSNSNPTAAEDRERVIQNFIALNGTPLCDRVREIILNSRSIFESPQDLREVFADSRFNPITRTPRGPIIHNGFTSDEVEKMDTKMFFIYKSKIHYVTVTRQPPNQEFDNRDINETRITKKRAKALWDENLVYHMAHANDDDMSTKKQVTDESLIYDSSKSVNVTPEKNKQK